MYLKDHPAYIGPVRSTRFEWKEQVDLGGSGGFVEHHMNTASSNTSAMMMNYEMLGIDLEKFKGEDDEMSGAYAGSTPVVPVPRGQGKLTFNQ